MKKSITFAALLVAGTSFINAAETISAPSSLQNGLAFYWDFSTSGLNDYKTVTGSTNSFKVWGDTGATFKTALDEASGMHYADLGSLTQTPYANDLTLSANSMSISMKVKNFSENWKNLVGFGTGNGETNCFQVQGNGKDSNLFSIYVGESIGGSEKQDVESMAIGTDEVWTSIVITLAEGEISSYVNGTLVGTGKYDGTGKTINSLQFAGLPGDTARNAGSLHLADVAIWDRALSADEASFVATNTAMTAMSISIPEPSVFGILAGMGALALVASRRRRK